MAVINTYDDDQTGLGTEDRLLGSNENGATRNFRVGDLSEFIIGNIPTPVLPNDAANKDYVDQSGTVDLSNYVTLDGVQTITGEKSFFNRMNLLGTGIGDNAGAIRFFDSTGLIQKANISMSDSGGFAFTNSIGDPGVTFGIGSTSFLWRSVTGTNKTMAFNPFTGVLSLPQTEVADITDDHTVPTKEYVDQVIVGSSTSEVESISSSLNTLFATDPTSATVNYHVDGKVVHFTVTISASTVALATETEYVYDGSISLNFDPIANTAVNAYVLAGNVGISPNSPSNLVTGARVVNTGEGFGQLQFHVQITYATAAANSETITISGSYFIL